MMDDLEQRLQRARRTEPSADLDRHIEGIFHPARANAPAVAALSARNWWLGAVAAGLSLGVTAVMAQQAAAPAPAEIVIDNFAFSPRSDLPVPKWILPGRCTKWRNLHPIRSAEWM